MTTPPLIQPTDRTVWITVQQRSPVTPAEAFRVIAPIDLTTVFHPVAPFPGIRSVANQTEAWDHVGPTRNPQYDDGSQADEQLTECTEGTSFAYQLTGFTNVTQRPAAMTAGNPVRSTGAAGAGRRCERPPRIAGCAPFRRVARPLTPPRP